MLSLLLRVLDRRALTDRAFGWYLDQAHPRFADGGVPQAAATAGARASRSAGEAHSLTPSHSWP